MADSSAPRPWDEITSASLQQTQLKHFLGGAAGSSLGSAAVRQLWLGSRDASHPLMYPFPSGMRRWRPGTPPNHCGRILKVCVCVCRGFWGWGASNITANLLDPFFREKKGGKGFSQQVPDNLQVTLPK